MDLIRSICFPFILCGMMNKVLNRQPMISDIEAGMFVEYIQNHIRGSIDDIHEKCIKLVGKTEFNLVFHIWTDKELKRRIHTQIIRPYAAGASRLIRQIDRMIMEFFGVDALDDKPRLNGDAFRYRVNNRLIKSYYKTEILAEFVEEMINQTLDLTLMGKLRSTVARETINHLSPGGIAMRLIGLNRYDHTAMNNRDVRRRMLGVSKNFSARIKGLLADHYARSVYRLAEELRDCRAPLENAG